MFYPEGQSNHKSLKGRNFQGHGEERGLTLEDGAGRCDMNKMLQAEEGEHEPRNVGSLQKLGKAK